MEKIENKNIDYGKFFYSLKRNMLDMPVLTRDGEPILTIPEELVEDFIQILSKSRAADRMLNEGKNKNDIPEEVFHKPENKLHPLFEDILNNFTKPIK